MKWISHMYTCLPPTWTSLLPPPPSHSSRSSQSTKLSFPVIHNRFLLAIFGEGNGTPLQYSCLENPMDGGAWWAAVRGVAKSRTRLSDFTFIFHFHALEKEMATHSSVLAWRIPGTGEPGGLLSTRSHRVGHDWNDLAAAAICFTHRSVYPSIPMYPNPSPTIPHPHIFSF